MENLLHKIQKAQSGEKIFFLMQIKEWSASVENEL